MAIEHTHLQEVADPGGRLQRGDVLERLHRLRVPARRGQCRGFVEEERDALVCVSRVSLDPVGRGLVAVQSLRQRACRSIPSQRLLVASGAVILVSEIDLAPHDEPCGVRLVAELRDDATARRRQHLGTIAALGRERRSGEAEIRAHDVACLPGWRQREPPLDRGVDLPGIALQAGQRLRDVDRVARALRRRVGHLLQVMDRPLEGIERALAVPHGAQRDGEVHRCTSAALGRNAMPAGDLLGTVVRLPGLGHVAQQAVHERELVVDAVLRELAAGRLREQVQLASQRRDGLWQIIARVVRGEQAVEADNRSRATARDALEAGDRPIQPLDRVGVASLALQHHPCERLDLGADTKSLAGGGQRGDDPAGLVDPGQRLRRLPLVGQRQRLPGRRPGSIRRGVGELGVRLVECSELREALALRGPLPQRLGERRRLEQRGRRLSPLTGCGRDLHVPVECDEHVSGAVLPDRDGEQPRPGVLAGARERAEGREGSLQRRERGVEPAKPGVGVAEQALCDSQTCDPIVEVAQTGELTEAVHGRLQVTDRVLDATGVELAAGLRDQRGQPRQAIILGDRGVGRTGLRRGRRGSRSQDSGAEQPSQRAHHRVAFPRAASASPGASPLEK
jgi:hypothetical protein